VDVAIEVSRTMGSCSPKLYDRAEKILEAAYEGTEKKK